MIGSYVRNLLRLTKSSYGDGTKATGTAIAQDGQLIVSHSWQTAFLRLRTHHNVKVPLVSDTVTTMESNQGVRINGAPVTRNGVPPVTNKQQNHHQDANVDEISAIAPNAISTDTVLTTSDNTAGISRVGIDATMNKGVADFFSPEIFNIVLHNPTTAHQLLRFSQNRFCGENMEFLEKADRFNFLIDELTKTMSEIYHTFTAVNAPSQLNLPQIMTKTINRDIKHTSMTTLPSLELIFADAQKHVEKILATDVYPRFVRHQLTTSAMTALSDNSLKYAGLGDCFCLTHPATADNPILYASDGFVKVTGYSRTDIIPRNCRFLQGNYTDKNIVRRLKASIDDSKESVELILNYRKTGEPFWNLLYVAPLFDSKGKLAFFLGGQINCSTTIHNCSDILRVLSVSDAPEEENAIVPTVPTKRDIQSSRKNFFKSLLSRSSSKVVEEREAGMEQELIGSINSKKLNVSNQMRIFYNAYSKYLVMAYDTMQVEFFSAGVVEMLGIDPKTNNAFFGNEVFDLLNRHSAGMSKDFKNKVRGALKMGRAISAEMSLFLRSKEAPGVSQKFLSHWTPLKDEHANVRYIVLTLGMVTDKTS
ncbi:hypothetical protein MMC12_005658 [Toensbergia leucococca]|nr:hypothetical protein [Toensbergia leucococca]